MKSSSAKKNRAFFREDLVSLILRRISVNSAGCFEWIQDCVGEYGGFYIRAAGRMHSIKAHRLSWLVFRGPIPAGLMILHRCNNKQCVNPSHLYIGTNTDNMRDASRDGLLVATFGERNGASKLTADCVSRIRGRIAGGESARSIAKSLGIAPQTVNDIRNRITWKHVA